MRASANNVCESSPEDCCKMLADAGADVVGLNCIRGPRTMLPLIAKIVGAVDVPVAALPVRTMPASESDTRSGPGPIQVDRAGREALG